ncbi:MAG: ATP-binding protein, partial [Ignavibacteria bacterium]|nr:ATP-binding protein [Ignavibacteria bacterium]
KLESIATQDDDMTRFLNEFKTQLYDAIEEVKFISNDLSPVGLRASGIESALNNLIQNIQPPAGLEIEFSSHGLFENLSEKIRIFLYRITQEALTNALKHSRATHIHLYLTETNEHLVLIIEDNGIGFDLTNEHLRKGNGLFNIKERCVALGGSFDLESVISHGTTIRVKVPKYNREG